MNKKLLIGLDLSFNSTGICATYLEDDKPQIMRFYRIVFDDESNKTGKIYNPKDIPNINQVIYRMPTNISVEELTENEKISNEQVSTTLRAMICSKKICIILNRLLSKFIPDEIIFTIENYVMPSFGGPNSLKNVSGLILLQGYVREFIIKFKIGNPLLNIKVYTPSPTQNKLSFCGNGKADKSVMINYFKQNYDNKNQLLPDISKGKIDDIVDAFSLMIYGYKKYLKL